MDELQRAAILLLGMGEKHAANVLRYMEPEKVEKLVKIMNNMGKVTQTEINLALDEFQKASKDQTSLGVNTKMFIKNALVNALGDEKATAIMDKSLDTENTGIDVLRLQDAKAVAPFVRDEHPQVIAVILSYLDNEKAAQVLKLFPKEQRIETMRRIANLSEVSPQALKELNLVIENSARNLKSFKTLSVGGAKLAANIINYLDTDTEDEIMEDFSQYDEELSEKILEFIFPFERLADLDKRSIQTVLREASNEDLILALKGVDESVQETFLGNMSERAADMIRDDLEAMGPTTLSKVTKAQKSIVAVAQKMAKEGKIVMGSQGEEMV